MVVGLQMLDWDDVSELAKSVYRQAREVSHPIIYGDFKFDRLAENSGDYTIEITADGRTIEVVNVALGQSKSLADIRLT